MTKKVFTLVLLVGIAVSSSAVSQEMPSVDWTPGMYWTYHTDVVSSGIRTEGTLTFLVLAEDASYGLHRWHLAVITEWYDGTEIVATAAHSAPASPFPWRRWPLIIEFLPPKHLPDFRNQYRRSIGSLGLPWWFCEERSVQVDIHQTDAWAESIVLTELQRGTENGSECIANDAVAIQYEWTSSLWDAEVEHVEGTAWWSLQSEWWAYAEGRGPEGTYEVCLDSSGVLTAEEIILRLSNALTSTAAINPEYADGLRGVFERIGVDLSIE